MSKSFWSNKRVLVTGAGGFIGSHLVELLVQEGAQVKAFVRYNGRGDPGLLSLVNPQVFDSLEIITGDLRDLSAVTAALQNVECVFHLGAVIAIPYSYQHPAEVVETNVLGTLNVLLAARDQGVARIVHTSTSEVYGTALYAPIDEIHPLQGQSPYSASKIGADKLAESFYRAFDLPIVTVRPFNTYGPRQSARAVIPTIISQALTQEIIHLGNLSAMRDFTYVSDTAAGFLKAGETSGIEGKTLNLGTGQEVRVSDLAEEIIKIIGRPVEIQVDEERIRPGKSEVQRLISDNRMAKECMGWYPEVNMHQGLEQTIEWIREHLHTYRPGIYQR